MRIHLGVLPLLTLSIASAHPNLSLRDASTLISSQSYNNEGENHDPLWVPDGAQLRTLSVGDNGDQLALYWSTDVNDLDSQHAFVMFHGKLRDGNDYWLTMNNALESALNDKYPAANPNSTVVAPQFFSTFYNSGQYTDSELAWGDLNAWQAGEVATHPVGTKSSSLDAIDALVDTFANKTAFPNLTNVTLVGHGGGGQLIQRYAVVGKDPPPGIFVRYIVGDPSTSVYFTPDRPTVSEATIPTCDLYDTWRYGLTNFTGTLAGLRDPIDYFQTYISRDVVNLVGLQDTQPDGDQTCPGLLQGGTARRNRNLAWFKYINTLARTNYDVSGFFGEFGALPDWSNVTLNEIGVRLIVIETADHDANEVFGSDEGRAALFNKASLPTGWRPDGWNASGNGQDVAATHAPAPPPKPSALSTLRTGAAAPPASARASIGPLAATAALVVAALASL